MRAAKLPLFLIVSTALATACRQPLLTRPAKPHEAAIEIVCHDGGSTSSVVPNTIEWDSVNHLKWSLTNASNVSQVTIGPKGTNPWPFTDPSYKTTPGHSVTARMLKNGLDGGTYKYTVSAECPPAGNAPAFPVVIDPDMIIPKTQF